MIIFIIQVLDEDDTLDENIAFYGDTMSVGTIDDDFVMPTKDYYDDHDWGDNYDASFDLENLFEYLMMNLLLIIFAIQNIESGFERMSTLGKKNPTNFGEY